MNLGLSKQLQTVFTEIIPVPRPLVEKILILIELLVSQLVKGVFFVKLSKSNMYKTGTMVSLKFQICQHTRDFELIHNLPTYFGCL